MISDELGSVILGQNVPDVATPRCVEMIKNAILSSATHRRGESALRKEKAYSDLPPPSDIISLMHSVLENTKLYANPERKYRRVPKTQSKRARHHKIQDAEPMDTDPQSLSDSAVNDTAALAGATEIKTEVKTEIQTENVPDSGGVSPVNATGPVRIDPVTRAVSRPLTDDERRRLCLCPSIFSMQDGQFIVNPVVALSGTGSLTEQLRQFVGDRGAVDQFPDWAPHS